jgi:vanillate O-demethylase ferredoxin subunit
MGYPSLVSGIGLRLTGGPQIMSNRLLTVAVSGIRQLTPRVREYLLKSAIGEPLPRYEPGAHIELYSASPATGPFIRHYSLIGGSGSWDDAANTYRIAIQRESDSRASAFIHDTLSLGTKLVVSGPKNSFYLDGSASKSLLIAGGIGITPIYAMLRSLTRRKKEFEFIYSGRTREGLAYVDDVLRLAGPNGRLHISGGSVRRRLDLGPLLAIQPAGTHVYVCGPQSMINAAATAGEELGWAPERVHTEIFIAQATGEEVPFDVELRESNLTVRVGRDTTILDALTAAGHFALSDCRRGECGLCPLPVLEADGPIDHRDRYLTEEERASGQTMCICVSRIKGTRLVLDA